MPKFVATYDIMTTIPDPNSEFIERAKGFGWSCWIATSEDQSNRLPNTTLVGVFDNLSAAECALAATANATRAALGTPVIVRRQSIVEERADESHGRAAAAVRPALA